MNETSIVTSTQNIVAVKPTPRCSVSIRAAAPDDLPFIDTLQKMHSHMVGWTPTKQLEAHIAQGNMLIAEDESQTPLGYCLARDQYMKRDDVGIVYQLNVLPLKQRHLVGASLIKGVFDRAAYGCKLFCCWCAQDIQANYFWESIGFIALAFRTGSRAKQRIHIFWQRRVRENDAVTPYWFPHQTSNGAVSEDRIVLPIPPGTHWRDAKPVLLPELPVLPTVAAQEKEAPKQLPGGAPVSGRPVQAANAGPSKAQRAAMARTKSKHLAGVPAGKAAMITRGGLRYIERGDGEPEQMQAEQTKPKRPRKSKPRQKNDPKYVKAARELRDRFLEQVNVDRLLPAACGKYDVSRQLEGPASSNSHIRIEHVKIESVKLLDAA